MAYMINTETFATRPLFSRAQYLAILFFLILLTAYTTYEVYDELLDLEQGESPLTVWLEILIVSSSLGFIFYITRLLYTNMMHQKQMEQTLQQVRQQLHSSNQHLQQGKNAFRETIEWQLDEWQLTQAQKEIAVLLLKGLTPQEIAEARHVQVKTVRNHLSAIYEKSSLPGRHVFCAWFFEGLF
jgi:DNA-binding CsgD family transcriptional regulator